MSSWAPVSILIVRYLIFAISFYFLVAAMWQSPDIIRPAYGVLILVCTVVIAFVVNGIVYRKQPFLNSPQTKFNQ